MQVTPKNSMKYLHTETNVFISFPLNIILFSALTVLHLDRSQTWFTHYFFCILQPSLSEVDRPENGAQVQPERERLSLPVQSSEEAEEMEGAVGGATGGTDEDFSSIEWMLSAGVEDPDLMAKIR